MTFLFGVSPGTWSETPCRANLNSELEPALEIQEHLQEEGEPENEKPPNEKSKISILEVVGQHYKAFQPYAIASREQHLHKLSGCCTSVTFASICKLAADH